MGSIDRIEDGRSISESLSHYIERRAVMRIEIKNRVVAVVLFCLGFALGRITFAPDVNASLHESQIGRYQLIAGEITLPNFFWNEDGAFDTSFADSSGPTLFRIDTKTGDAAPGKWQVSLPGSRLKDS